MVLNSDNDNIIKIVLSLSLSFYLFRYSPILLKFTITVSRLAPLSILTYYSQPPRLIRYSTYYIQYLNSNQALLVTFHNCLTIARKRYDVNANKRTCTIPYTFEFHDYSLTISSSFNTILITPTAIKIQSLWHHENHTRYRQKIG